MSMQNIFAILCVHITGIHIEIILRQVHTFTFGGISLYKRRVFHCSIICSLVIILRYVDMLMLDNLITSLYYYFLYYVYILSRYLLFRADCLTLGTHFSIRWTCSIRIWSPTCHIQSTSSIQTYIDYCFKFCRYICIKWTSSIRIWSPTCHIQSTSSTQTYTDHCFTLCRYICVKWISSTRAWSTCLLYSQYMLYINMQVVAIRHVDTFALGRLFMLEQNTTC